MDEAFNEKPKRGIKALEEAGLLPVPLQPPELAIFLRETARRAAASCLVHAPSLASPSPPHWPLPFRPSPLPALSPPSPIA